MLCGFGECGWRAAGALAGVALAQIGGLAFALRHGLAVVAKVLFFDVQVLGLIHLASPSLAVRAAAAPLQKAQPDGLKRKEGGATKATQIKPKLDRATSMDCAR